VDNELSCLLDTRGKQTPEDNGVQPSFNAKVQSSPDLPLQAVSPARDNVEPRTVQLRLEHTLRQSLAVVLACGPFCGNLLRVDFFAGHAAFGEIVLCQGRCVGIVEVVFIPWHAEMLRD
jgi:hypothetical protein